MFLEAVVTRRKYQHILLLQDANINLFSITRRQYQHALLLLDANIDVFTNYKTSISTYSHISRRQYQPTHITRRQYRHSH